VEGAAVSRLIAEIEVEGLRIFNQAGFQVTAAAVFGPLEFCALVSTISIELCLGDGWFGRLVNTRGFVGGVFGKWKNRRDGRRNGWRCGNGETGFTVEFDLLVRGGTAFFAIHIGFSCSTDLGSRASE
jgi:hypothetical protein